MLKQFGLGAAVFVLAACGGSDGDYQASMSPAPPAPVAMDQMVAGSDGFAPERKMSNRPSGPDVGGEPAPETAEQYIAYSHSLGLTLPKGGVDPMMQAHTEACRAAGTATCIVINSNIYSEDVDYASGNLSIRATPDWIETFLDGMETEVDAAGGEITQRSTSAEDLTRAILDTGARLEAQKTLQGRLLDLLQRRDGELGDLLQIERELARVTGDIESIEAQLKTLRLRVSMSRLDVSYSTKVPPFSATRENPLAEAFGDFFYNFSAAIAAVITAFAVGLPWIVLLAIFLWIWLKLIWPRLRGKKKA
ncbi:MAG: DUF4349 domain-containing protein [Henriciella sp.]|nr:DUF4349 domain-containing protein [Henriciella sp.]